MTCHFLSHLSDITIFYTTNFCCIISFLTKALGSGILFSTFFNCLLAKLLISGFDSVVLILFSNSLTLLLKALVCNNPLTSGIFSSRLPTLVS